MNPYFLRFLFFCLSISFQAQGQQVFFIKDSKTLEAIPFVKIFPNDTTPFISDLDGMISLKSSTSSFKMKYPGYNDSIVEIAKIEGDVIYYEERIQDIKEVVVEAGENRAHRIIKEVIANRKQNHPLSKDAFRYTSYGKFIFDTDPEILATITDSTSDTTMLNVKEFFDSQHLFLIESATKRSFIPPFKDKEEITAYKASGFSDPLISTFVNSMQSFSFYDNQFEILGEQYVNPIALGGIRRYLFVLEDTLIHDRDTTFTIFYRPRSNKEFHGMTGRLFINTNGYAIEKVIASPYNDEGSFNLEIVQEYEFIDNKKWFPVKLNTRLEIKDIATVSAGGKSLPIIGTGSSYIENIEINPIDMERFYDDNIKIATAENADDLDSNSWSELRKYQLSDKENQTYNFLDSVAEKENFTKYIRLLKILLDGKVPLGYFNMPLDRLIDYNQFEGFRLGFGIETSDKLMKPLMIGSYLAYGFKDKRLKYGAYSTIYLNYRRGLEIDLRYQEDAIERGGVDRKNLTSSMLDENALRNFFISEMDYQRLAEVSIKGDLKANITTRFFGNYQRVFTTQGYQFPLNGIDSVSTFDGAEVGLVFNWNFGEEYMLLGKKKVSLGSNNPKLEIVASKGFKGLFESELDYWRCSASLSQDVKFKMGNRFTWKVEASILEGNVPLYLQYVGKGTGINYAVSVPGSFETMLPNTFYNKEQIALFMQYKFREISTKATWNQPQFGLHFASGYGRVKNVSEIDLPYKTMERGFHEAGLTIDKLIQSGFMGIGFGGFYNFGMYASDNWKNNIFGKFTMSMNLN